MKNKFLPKLKKKNSNCVKLLEFLQKNPELEVAGVDFIKRRDYPFLGLIPSARLSELLGLGMVEVVGRRKGKQTTTQAMNLYKITEKGLNFKI